MMSPKTIGKMLTNLTDTYGSERNRLYSEYELNCMQLFHSYTTGRKVIIGRYVEAIERLERDHGQKCEPLDFGYQHDEETLDKDIACDHVVMTFDDFERGRFEADADLISKLNKLYATYREARQKIDRTYHTARHAAYSKYKTQRDELENEGRSEPANNS